MLILKIFSVLFLVYYAQTARILGVFPLDWGSHYILGTKLMRGLAEAGHNVTMISPHKYKDPPVNGSWTDVVLDGFAEEFKVLLEEADLMDKKKKGNIEKMQSYARLLITVSNHTLRNPSVHKLIKDQPTFDVVIIDNIMNECHYAFAHIFNCPIILLSSIGPNSMTNSKVGNPAPVPVEYHSRIPSENMSFMGRLKKLLMGIGLYVIMDIYMHSQNNKILHEVFPNAPDLSDLIYNTSLILLNSHSSINNAVPLVPNMVEVGGFYIDPPKKLPEDLKSFLDSARDGAVYFSLGSSIKSKDMSKHKKEVLINVFKKLKQKILWKFEEDLPGKPDNVLIKKWMPQQDILAHPNIKLFITHGGLLSTIETIYHGVPVLAIPVFGDQDSNAELAVQNGYGLKISYHDKNFNEETVFKLIEELLKNPSYRENAQHRSRIYHDKPMTAMQSAVYWVEYAVRHKGAPHLRVAGAGMRWYKYFMVDVFVLLFSSALLFTFGTRYILRTVFYYILKRRNSTKVKIN